MAVPINIPTGRVVGQFVMGVVDGDGPDAKPQFVPARGAIDFTSSPPYLPANTGTAEPVTVLKTTTTAVLDSEGFICTPSAMNPELPARRGIPLMATDAKGSSVEGWTWTVSARFTDENGAGLAVTIPEFNFALPANSVIDLTSVVKVPASSGIGEDQYKGLVAAAQAYALSAAADAKQAQTDSSRALTETAKIPSEVAKAIAADTSVYDAAARAVDGAVSELSILKSSDPRLPSILQHEDLVAAVVDSTNRQTWLAARLSDGGPTDWAMGHLSERLGVSRISTHGYLAALVDSQGNMTDFSIRDSDGQVDDFVIARWAKRMQALLDIPEPVAGGGAGSNSDLVPILQSIANAAGRHSDKAALPANPTNLTVNTDQPARLLFPNRYTDATPMPLIIHFEGVGDTTLDPRAQYKPVTQEAGVLYAKCNFHGNSYGSPAAMADARALYDAALRIAPISGVILSGNSMGGAGALNALHTGTIPNVLGVYLSDPVCDLRQRFDNGRAPEIKAAYGIAADGSDYAVKTRGYDPMLAPVGNFKGVPIKIIHSRGDTSVVLALHGQKLKAKLDATNKVEIIDTGSNGHNVPDRFNGAELLTFITQVSGGTVGLRA